ncbi:MAG: DnaJ domain-containing protein [Candidatus Rokubacteria bacterium]|nr:DnaJ domain-containing protein [Candidatus Rokubacteria bacterium]
MATATARRDYYDVLGVPRDAKTAAIKDAFRGLALRYHPDRNKEPGAADRFREIAEAYAVLSDPKKRAEYDRAGFAAIGDLTPEDLFGGIDLDDLLGGLGFDAGGGLFDRFFGRRRAGPPRGADLTVDLEVPLVRVLAGGEEQVHVRRPETCGDCRGSGAEHGTAVRACAPCGGSGRQVTSRRETGIAFQRISTCPACGGRGTVVERACPRCSGRGEVERAETLAVKIPAGIEEGVALRIPGRGVPGGEAGGVPGDLYVVVRTTPDARWHRDDVDLWRTETIGVADAVLGTRIDVPTLDGHRRLTIPPGIQPGTVLRLRGQGLPAFGGGRRGDLHVRVDVHVPERPSAEARTLWERLRQLESERAGRAPVEAAR